MPSTREKQNKQVGEEILELLSKPTAKERSLAEKFKSQGGAQVKLNAQLENQNLKLTKYI